MSNKLGQIYGTVKDGKGSIIINSNTIDICGNLLMNGLISLCSSNEEVAAADPSVWSLSNYGDLFCALLAFRR